MVNKLLGFMRDSNDKQVKRLQGFVDEINDLAREFEALSDADLHAKTEEFRLRLGEGEELDDLQPEAFAAVREAAHRTIGLRHFDVQLMGGAVLHQGKIAEMRTGEGKTLVATLPVYLNALDGQGAHLVTVNDYLARRDASWMGPVYHALGLTVGCLQHDQALLFDPDAEPDADGYPYPYMRAIPRREAYAADIVYGTNNEFGFDYLRDNMVGSAEQRVQRPLHFGIVDEVDNILIDEARTPLIISGPAEESTKLYNTFAQVVPRLKMDEDYILDEKDRTVILTEKGISKVERLVNVTNLYDPANYVYTHFVENALKAHVIFLRDKDYVVQNGEVIIVDEFTGRLMEGRRYSDGLHQALEAKEGVAVQRENITYATITLQNYFRMYPKLAGMTGTALTEAEEFQKVYALEVVAIPTHRSMVRNDLPDLVYKTEDSKFKAAADKIAELYEQRRPVLVGTVSIEQSEHLSDMLNRRGVKHEVLNAKQHEREALIVSQAGRPGSVTVATNMAGRGTDIILGGEPAEDESKETWQQRHNEVVEMGGLYIVGTERHESRRIDNQLRGRAGRQGDMGTTQFYISLEDEIMRRFGGDRIKTVMNWAGIADDVPLESRIVTKAVDNTQVKVEASNFDIRKQLVEYDDVMNRHREVIYEERGKVLSGADLRANMVEMINAEVSSLVSSCLQGEPDDWEADILLAEVATVLPLDSHITEDYVRSMSPEEVEDELLEAANELYERREQELSPETVRMLERAVMLQTIDRLWVQHLTTMQNLRQGIGLHAFGQRDPLVMYKMEGHKQFQELRSRIQHDIAHTIYHVVPASQGSQQAQPTQASQNGVASKQDASAVSRPTAVNTGQVSTVMSRVAAGPKGEPVASRKVGRNDPCPCGSGKKYKRCHGINL
jgi:preprotein translocase subunit SecA